MRKRTLEPADSSARSSSTSDEAGCEIPPVRSEMHAGEHNLLESRTGDAVHFGEHGPHWHASRLAPRHRDDAVGAGLGATSLHAERERRASRDARLDRRPTASVAIAKTLGRGEAELDRQRRHQGRLLGVGNDPEHVRQGVDLIGLTGRVTPGDHDLSIRIGACQPSNGLSRALIRARRHRTGVDDHHVRSIRRRGSGPATRAQLLLDVERVGLVHAAAEGDDGILHGPPELPLPQAERQLRAGGDR